MAIIIGTYILDIFIPDSQSLKGKRFILKRIFDRIRSKGFNISISEVDHNDKWQRSYIAVSTVGNNVGHVNSTLDKALDFIERSGLVEVISARLEIFTIGDI